MTQSVLLTQLPLLVDNLINWYIWKAKIKECNKECVKFLTGAGEWVYQYIQHRYLYKDERYHSGYIDPIIRSFINFSKYPVAILPKRYFYTSGRNSKQGYKFTNSYLSRTGRSPGRKLNRILPDFSFF
jgi:hypothetical protein